jgi:hypothetical protein
LGDEIYLTYLIAVVGMWEEGRGGNHWALWDFFLLRWFVGCFGMVWDGMVCYGKGTREGCLDLDRNNDTT